MTNASLACVFLIKSWMDPPSQPIELQEGITLSKDQLKGNGKRYFMGFPVLYIIYNTLVLL